MNSIFIQNRYHLSASRTFKPDFHPFLKTIHMIFVIAWCFHIYLSFDLIRSSQNRSIRGCLSDFISEWCHANNAILLLILNLLSFQIIIFFRERMIIVVSIKTPPPFKWNEKPCASFLLLTDNVSLYRNKGNQDKTCYVAGLILKQVFRASFYINWEENVRYREYSNEEWVRADSWSTLTRFKYLGNP